MNPPRRLSSWLPDRGEVIWIDHNPQAGREMKDHHPFLVLSLCALRSPPSHGPYQRRPARAGAPLSCRESRCDEDAKVTQMTWMDTVA